LSHPLSETASLSLALTLHRQAHRRLQCICQMTSACSTSFGYCVAVASSFLSVASSLSLLLALTLYREAHRRLHCIRPVISACSFSSSFRDYVTIVSSLSVAYSLSLPLALTLHRQAHRRLQCIRLRSDCRSLQGKYSLTFPACSILLSFFLVCSTRSKESISLTCHSCSILVSLSCLSSSL
jgi:hypothetical protein